MELKDKVFSELSLHRGEYISGQSLANTAGVSRNAVWKAVNELKKDGCDIVSVTKRGYLLVSDGGKISGSEISDILGKDVLVRIFDKTDSTNNEAKRMLSDGFSGKALIVANEQTSGRGRLGRSFFSPASTGIYFTAIIPFSSSLADASLITAAASVAVIRTIETLTDKHVGIKWVNDIYLDGKKICGILTEAVTDLESGRLSGLAVGIGINLSTEDFPDEISSVAASLGIKNADRALIAARIAKELFSLSEDLSSCSFLEEYKAHSIILGKEINYFINGEAHPAIAKDIDERGGLIVILPDGTKTALRGGEITIRIK
ncbi:MAG: biotin--[acetyl-CoA-carboxylase] ligase [Eubacteriales bacterium]